MTTTILLYYSLSLSYRYYIILYLYYVTMKVRATQATNTNLYCWDTHFGIFECIMLYLRSFYKIRYRYKLPRYNIYSVQTHLCNLKKWITRLQDDNIETSFFVNINDNYISNIFSRKKLIRGSYPHITTVHASASAVCNEILISKTGVRASMF